MWTVGDPGLRDDGLSQDTYTCLCVCVRAYFISHYLIFGIYEINLYVYKLICAFPF